MSPRFLEEDDPAIVDLSRVMGSHVSATLLLFVEQSIALQAAAFVGTPKSSATWTLAQERVAARATVESVRVRGEVEFMFKSGKGGPDIRSHDGVGSMWV